MQLINVIGHKCTKNELTQKLNGNMEVCIFIFRFRDV